MDPFASDGSRLQTSLKCTKEGGNADKETLLGMLLGVLGNALFSAAIEGGTFMFPS